MEQQQFKVSFPLGTKLLISVVTLLFVSIAFLDVSTILLLEKDKRAYTYQSQGSESLLVGRELVNMARHVLDTLRLSMVTLDPLKPVTSEKNTALVAVLDNQSEVAAITVQLIDPVSGEQRIVARASKAEGLTQLNVKVEDLEIPKGLLMAELPGLLKSGYAFFNVSKLDKPPVLAFAFADLSTQDRPGGFAAVIGYVSLRGLGGEIKDSHVTVVNKEGWVLFDSDPTAFFRARNISDDPLFAVAVSSPVSSGAAEYDLDGTRLLGSYQRPGYDLVVLSRTDWKKANSATYVLIEKFLLLGAMAIGAAIIFALVFSKTVTRPINRLYQATRAVASGDFNVTLEAKGRDEIGALSTSFMAMSAKINTLIGDGMRKVQLENDIALASTVQQTLIPPSLFQNANIEIHSHYQAAETCGGDWWGFFGVGKKMCLMIADATGHGLPSALITASARSCVSVMHKLATDDPDFSFSPSAMLSFANRVVHDAGGGKIMMTFFVGVIDFETMKLSYSSAGHNPPWLFQKKEDGGFSLESLTAIGNRLGEGRDVAEYEEHEISIARGDLLFLYTDGLLEGKNMEGEMYGKKRTRKTVMKSIAQGPEAIVSGLVSDFLSHSQGKVYLDDDVTLAVAQILV